MRPQFRFAAIVLSLGLLVGAGAAGFATSAAHTYVVQPGDSLWAISQADGLTVSQLAAANHMDPNDLLLIGRDLVIPSNDPAPATTQSASSAGTSGGTAASNPWTFCSSFVP